MIISSIEFKMCHAWIYVNFLNFRQQNSNWDMTFFNSSLNSKLGVLNVDFRFVNVALVGLHNFFQFMIVMEYWDFSMLASAVLPDFTQFTKELEIWYFWVLLAFRFCWILRTVFQACYLCRIGGADLWLNYQFSREELFTNVYAVNLCQFKCWGYCFQV